MVQTCCEPTPNGDKPTVEDVKELMKTAEMRIPVDSKLLAKMMANCPNEEIMAKLTTMQVDQFHAMKFTAEVKEFLKTREMRPPSSTTLMALAATDGIGCYQRTDNYDSHGRHHNKLLGTSDNSDSDSDEADRRKLRMFDGVSVQGSTLLAARMRSSMEPFSEGNITKWIKALPEQGA
jgi:hypothetical protein